MSADAAKIRRSVRWSFLAVLVGLLVAGNAQAQTTCTTDKDCPGTACGGQVCHKSSGLATCVDANTVGLSGFDDGWCSDNGTAVDSNCKCASLGATCNGLNCSFTIPPDGGAGGSSSGTGGGTGTGGSSGAGGGSSGGAGTSGGGGGGGCSVAGTPSFGSVAGCVLLAGVLIRRRARRRA